MRILNESDNRPLKRIVLYLTPSEAIELQDSLANIIKNPSHSHEHISSDDYKKEITICIYESTKLDHFDERSKKLILEDI